MEKFNFILGSFLGTIKAMFTLRLWLPFFLFALLSFAIVWLLTNPFMPVLGPVIAGVSKLITGSDAITHYPEIYVLLPMTYGRIALVLSVLIEALLVGSGFLLFSGHYRHERLRVGGAIRGAAKKYPQIVAVWLFYTIVFLAMIIYLPKLFDSFIGGSPRRTLAFHILLRFVGSGILAMFMYVVPYVVLDSLKFTTAIGRSIRTFFRNPFSSYFLALVPYLLTVPFTLALFDPMMIVRKFSPELILYLISAEIVVSMIANFVFTSTVLRFYWEYAE